MLLSMRPSALSSLSATSACACGWTNVASPRTICRSIVQYLLVSIPLPLASIPKPGKPVLIVPGLLSAVSMTTVGSTSPARKGIPAFSMITAPSSTSRPDGSWHPMADTSPSLTAVALVGSVWSAIPTSRLQPFPRSTSSEYASCIVHRADGYYCQFGVKADRVVDHQPTGKQIGIDVGLLAFYTDSEGNAVENPRHYRKAEKKLKRLQRQLSRKHKQSTNRKKARKQVARAHLKVQRQREDFARKQANTLVSSHDLIAYEQLQIRNMVKNRHLAKSIHDAGWGTFISWVKAYGLMHHVPVIAVAPQFTSQECSACGALVKKSLSVRTHICTSCGVVLDRDHNAALNILAKALACTLGHRGTSGSPANASGQTASTRLSPRKTSKRAG